MPTPPCNFSPIFTDFSNAQLLLKPTTNSCIENAKPRGKCDCFLLHCHSATTHHLSAMKITDCMLPINCKLKFLSLPTLHHYKIPLLLILCQSHSIPVINLCQILKSNHTEHSSHSYWIHYPTTIWNSLPFPFQSNIIQLHHPISEYSKL